MLMFTREGSSCNNNRRLTGDMQQTNLKLLRLPRDRYWYSSLKAKNRCTIYREGPALFRRRKWKITFVRRTAFVLALKHPNGTKSAFTS